MRKKWKEKINNFQNKFKLIYVYINLYKSYL